MHSANALAEKDGEVTRNWRTEGREASVVALPRRGRNGAVVDEPIVNDAQSPRPLQERAVDAVAKALRYDEQLARLRRSQDRHVANIKARLGIVGENGKKMRQQLLRHESQLENHDKAIRDNRQRTEQLAEELMVTDGMCVQNQEDIGALSTATAEHDERIGMLAWRVDAGERNEFVHRSWLEHHDARLHNIEQALSRPRPTNPFLSGLNWKLAGGCVCAFIGVGMIAAHFLHLL